MENLKHTKIKDISEFLKTIGYKWSGIIVEGSLLKIATIEDFKDIVCLQMEKDNKTENLQIEVSDFNLFLEDKSLNQKFNFKDFTTMWQAFMIYHKNEDYSKLLYTKTISEKQQVEKSYNKKINLTQRLLEHHKYEKSLKVSKYNTTLLNIENKFNNSLNKENKNEINNL